MTHGRFKVIIDHSRSSRKNDNIIYCNANMGGGIWQPTMMTTILLEPGQFLKQFFCGTVLIQSFWIF